MAKIQFIFIGREKSDWVWEGIGHYRKLLKRMVDLEIKIVQPEKVVKSSDVSRILEIEKDKIIRNLKSKTFLVVLDVKGERLSSESLAHFFQSKINQGQSDFTFVVGSSLGLSEELKKKSGLGLSLSKMTFPHQLTWIVLLEQIYRAFSIIKGTKYHK